MKKPVIWITGASSGIGAATAKKFSKEGYAIVLSSRKEKELEKVKSECQYPEDCAILPLDLAEADSLPSKTEQAIQFFGHIDVMFHNGGISQRSLAMETEIEVDRKIMEVNYFGTIILTKALLSHFKERKSGHFAVTSSLVGIIGSPYRSSYAASKHALHGYFDSVRAEHFADNVAVTMICPGFIKTNVSVNAVTGDGKPLNQMDDAQANGMSAEKCAEKIFKGIKGRKEEIYIGGKEVMAIYLKRFVPGIFSKILQKAKVR
ncbi:SDR family oxidoreductase [Algoriphagus machipongonensis]|uniref:Dehydrogenase/reductase SDR family member 7B n=1 Tax=Algoriphagus machipongonensis TaxID=388413 RepID=A3HTR8_9BACT|nr:SDR family oxidoreductase [Algoriphagus machipongonensis]EAZ83236.1 dehydrogenase/reductase SDR family member 7B [Algoriphagus machipongonensis]